MRLYFFRLRLCQNLFYCLCDLVTLTVCPEVFLKLLTGQSALYQLTIQIFQNRHHISMRYFLDFIQYFLISLLRLYSLRRIATAAGCEQGVVECGQVDDTFLNRCIHLEEYAEKLNERLALARMNLSWRNKTAESLNM